MLHPVTGELLPPAADSSDGGLSLNTDALLLAVEGLVTLQCLHCLVDNLRLVQVELNRLNDQVLAMSPSYPCFEYNTLTRPYHRPFTEYAHDPTRTAL